jgi:hypothetical protein
VRDFKPAVGKVIGFQLRSTRSQGLDREQAATIGTSLTLIKAAATYPA